jgi:hypothetical protein
VLQRALLDVGILKWQFTVQNEIGKKFRQVRPNVELTPRKALNTKGVETVSNYTRQLRFPLEGKSMPVEGWEGFRDMDTSLEESGIGPKPSVPLYSST